MGQSDVPDTYTQAWGLQAWGYMSGKSRGQAIQLTYTIVGKWSPKPTWGKLLYMTALLNLIMGLNVLETFASKFYRYYEDAQFLDLQVFESYFVV